ncbi:ABC transporter permease [Variovorax sp. OV329]|uniref:ABC transporter permease n=1 Tax=Variovorax sp. OV329 TaxID=1882825 RepID=UPI0008F08E28|nr:ABC transporter permease [Variovorax sp. OV329]SFM32679.1 NitT/TauT family transport system permease protein [Variovorax sp. OV329]
MTSITEATAATAAVPEPDRAPTTEELKARDDALQRRDTLLRVAVPAAVICGLLVLWEAMVRIYQIPHYILPAPSLIFSTLLENWQTLAPALWFTVKLTLLALFAAIAGGVLLAIAFALFKWVEIGLFPIAVILQVTPIIAIAPLILIYVSSTTAALLLCAWIVAFFPILSNTVIGLKSADSNLRDLFTLYKASPWQTFRYLLVPSALPYFMAGLKIAGGLSLIGAVVAEFTAGTAGRETGLASRILESSFRTEIPMMFAALFLVSLLGIVIFLVFAGLSRMVLGHWHESEMKKER